MAERAAPRSPPPPDAAAVARAVAQALAEDLGTAGDVTTDAVVAEDCLARGRVVARSALVLSGVLVAGTVFRTLDPQVRFEVRRRDGEALAAGEIAAEIHGSARPILRGERTALNFLMRMSGIATATRDALREVAGTPVRILDTRKTAPGLRLLDKYAVACGGGTNHRLGLHDAVLIKDTHLGCCGTIGEAVRRARAAGHPRERITVEVREEGQLDEAIAAGAGRALLDNMDPEALRRAVRRADGRIELEASGGLRPGGLRPFAETGVSWLSVGWLTHSAPAADLALELQAS